MKSIYALAVVVVGTVGTAEQTAVSFPAADGATVHATWYRAVQPLRGVIVAFHQGGASGPAEYGPIVPRLNELGYHVLAVDQRSGGDRFDGANRTVVEHGVSKPFCDAAADLAGALRHVRSELAGVPVVLWGSSYSGALAIRLAVTSPDGVAGVLAFSPASGGPMSACRAEEVADGLAVPALLLRPRAEMERASSVQQFDLFRRLGKDTFVADPGTHGSSMLVEERVGAPVHDTWRVVERFLGRITPGRS